MSGILTFFNDLIVFLGGGFAYVVLILNAVVNALYGAGRDVVLGLVASVIGVMLSLLPAPPGSLTTAFAGLPAAVTDLLLAAHFTARLAILMPFVFAKFIMRFIPFVRV